MDISSNEKHLQVGFVVSDSQATTTFSKLSSVKPFGLTAALSPSKLRRFKENKRFKLLVVMYFIATVTNCVSCRGQGQNLQVIRDWSLFSYRCFFFCKRDVLRLLIGLRKLLFIIKFYIYLYKRIINCCGLCASH